MRPIERRYDCMFRLLESVSCARNRSAGTPAFVCPRRRAWPLATGPPRQHRPAVNEGLPRNETVVQVRRHDRLMSEVVGYPRLRPGTIQSRLSAHFWWDGPHAAHPSLISLNKAHRLSASACHGVATPWGGSGHDRARCTANTGTTHGMYTVCCLLLCSMQGKSCCESHWRAMAIIL